MLGPLRSSRASSLGQAGVFLFVCCLITSTLGSSRLFQQVPQNNTQLADTNLSSTNQTALLASKPASELTEEEKKNDRILIGVVSSLALIFLIGCLTYVIRREYLACKRAQTGQQSTQTTETESSENLVQRPMIGSQPYPASYVFSTEETLVVGNPVSSILAETTPAQTASPRRPQNLSPVPGLIYLDMRQNLSSLALPSQNLSEQSSLRYRPPTVSVWTDSEPDPLPEIAQEGGHD